MTIASRRWAMTELPYSQRPWTDGIETEFYREDPDDEPTPDDCMTEDHNRAVDEIHGLYPKPDDHDRRFSEVYDGRTDIGDELLPF
jgi:hypothetical protein